MTVEEQLDRLKRSVTTGKMSLSGGVTRISFSAEELDFLEKLVNASILLVALAEE